MTNCGIACKWMMIVPVALGIMLALLGCYVTPVIDTVFWGTTADMFLLVGLLGFELRKCFCEQQALWTGNNANRRI